MRHKPKKIETDELCKYGCGEIASYILQDASLICQSSSNKCPTLKKIRRLNRDYSTTYENIPDEIKARMTWNKGNLSADFKQGGRGNHKGVLLRDRGHQCERCGLQEWLGESIPIELDHIDGDNKNNCIENLRLLCPNCHAQTPTWRRRKGTQQQKCSEGEILDAVKVSENLNQALDRLNLRWGSGGTVLGVMSKHNVNFKGC